MTTPPPADAPSPVEFAPSAAAAPSPAIADEAYTPPQRSKLPMLLAAAAVALVLIAIAIGGTLWFTGRNDLTREQAQRECRTALEREAAQRKDKLGTARETGVLVSVAGVELQEAWETETGWAVNGTANFTLTTPLLGQTPHALNLTCEATGTDDGVRTTVKNRD